MARLPKCCSCEKCDWVTMTCKTYHNGIPKDIAVEERECKEYTLKKDIYNDDDLPLAKGW